MKAKPLNRLAADIKKGIANSTKKIARDVVLELKEAGPYWTGQFESSWRVDAPHTNEIDAIRPDESSYDVSEKAVIYKGETLKQPLPSKITKFTVPRVTGQYGWGGYVIGNLMEYRDEAMDLNPGRRLNYGNARRTAPKYWFDTWYNDELLNTMKLAVFTELNKALDSK